MKYNELLKLYRSNQIKLLTSLWLITCIISFFIAKVTYLNKLSYSCFGYADDYVSHLIFFFKIFGKFSLLFTSITLTVVLVGMQKIDIRNRILTIPIKMKSYQLNQLMVLQCTFSSIAFVLGIVFSFFFYFIFKSELTLIRVLIITTAINFLNVIAIMTFISFFYHLITLVNRVIPSLTLCIIIWMLSVFLNKDFLPPQWAFNLFSLQNDSHFFYLYLLLCIVVISFPFIKLTNSIIQISFLIFSTSLIFSCHEQENNLVTKNFKQKDDMLYVAFSVDVDMCSSELKEINKISAKLDMTKVQFITIDSKKTIDNFLLQLKIDSNIKFISINESQFEELFGTLSFPQVIMFKKGKKEKISDGYFPIGSIAKYVKKK